MAQQIFAKQQAERAQLPVERLYGQVTRSFANQFFEECRRLTTEN